MAWTVDQGREYLGLDSGDTSQDTRIQQVMDQTLSALEVALGRRLLFAREVETYYYLNSISLLLPRFPVKEVFTLVDPSTNFGFNLSRLKVRKSIGEIIHPELVGHEEIEVDYEGGYETLPPDLERDMWAAFQVLYDRVNVDTGAPDTEGNSFTSGGSGDISSVTLSDFGTIRWDTSPQAFSAAAIEKSIRWGWLAPWYTTFELYRSGTAGVGSGVA